MNQSQVLNEMCRPLFAFFQLDLEQALKKRLFISLLTNFQSFGEKLFTPLVLPFISQSYLVLVFVFVCENKRVESFKGG